MKWWIKKLCISPNSIIIIINASKNQTQNRLLPFTKSPTMGGTQKFANNLFCKSTCVSMMMNQVAATLFDGGCRNYTNSTKDFSVLTREWFVKLWLADEKNTPTTRKRWVKNVQGITNTAYASVVQDGFIPTPQPPLTQSAVGVLEPTTPQEFKIAPLLLRSNLLITRDIEWANLMLGFEQQLHLLYNYVIIIVIFLP
ncbi:hypothetical protein AQUCO_10500009v1 [Aquilegia coerulea]|uniref:Uncharacterized protein n=1 Tax=Aquilegia coerulea TaxID=218851 RepID=A0A2G5C3K6_AQUCA|nr:hypothetical protein AQUCO_10500009v1 [Aquilegia coerulea]